MDEQLRIILIIIVSVSIFGLLVFVFVRNYIKNKIDLIKALLHKYKHYLQPRSAEAYYYDLGFTYENNPMELEAISEEQNYKLFE